MSIFFTADEHYGHKNIIKYCNRPFDSVEEMDNEIIKRHNTLVGENDIVYHIGDFTLKGDAEQYISRLNGKHIFIQGSHDKFLPKETPQIIELNNPDIVLCHYAMTVWSKSHYNSWQLFGHSHGKLKGNGKQIDVGVDTHHFFPYSLDEIKKIMSKKEDNFNLVK